MASLILRALSASAGTRSTAKSETAGCKHKIGSRSVITADAARQYLASLPPLESAA